jgi:hypothetical protein
MNFGARPELLRSYQEERKPVALSVVETSGQLVRSTKYSERGTHAQDYVEIVRKRAGNITGMGIRYGEQGLRGSRLFDMEVYHGTNGTQGAARTRLYSLLNYTQFTLLWFGECKADLKLPDFVKVVQIATEKCSEGYWTESSPYVNQAILVRPDSYIESATSLEKAEFTFSYHSLKNLAWSMMHE